MDPLISSIKENIQAEINRFLVENNGEVNGFLLGLVKAQMLINRLEEEHLIKMSEDMLKETK